eukprot:365381-Chlamydomonas_euryale.AAC.22
MALRAQAAWAAGRVHTTESRPEGKIGCGRGRSRGRRGSWRRRQGAPRAGAVATLWLLCRLAGCACVLCVRVLCILCAHVDLGWSGLVA